MFLRKLKVESPYDPAIPLLGLSLSLSKSPGCVGLFVTSWTVAHPAPRSMEFSWQDYCCHSLLQGIFPTCGSNPGLLHCRQILYHLSHQGSPTPRHISGQIYNSKRYMCPYVHSSTIHNSQDMQTTQMSVDR